jgi:hypothetical protein
MVHHHHSHAHSHSRQQQSTRPAVVQTVKMTTRTRTRTLTLTLTLTAMLLMLLPHDGQLPYVVNAFSTQTVNVARDSRSFLTALQASPSSLDSHRNRRRDVERRRRRVKFLQNNAGRTSTDDMMDVATWREKQRSLFGGTGGIVVVDSESLRSDATSSRRTFFAKSIPLCAAASTLCGSSDMLNWGPAPANAANAPKDPYETLDPKAKVTAAFQSIKNELSPDIPFVEMGKGGGVPYLEGLIQSSNWPEVKEFTKFYDSEFRKAKLGYVRKKIMTSKAQQQQATLMSNAVTFDLIGINRAARAQDQTEALRYLGELKNDITTFLQYEAPLMEEAVATMALALAAE